MLWIAPDRLAVVGDRAVVVALGAIGEAAVVVNIAIFWIEPDRLVVVGDGAVEVAFGTIGVAAAVNAREYFGSSLIAWLWSAMARSRSPLAL